MVHNASKVWQKSKWGQWLTQEGQEDDSIRNKACYIKGMQLRDIASFFEYRYH